WPPVLGGRGDADRPHANQEGEKEDGNATTKRRHEGTDVGRPGAAGSPARLGACHHSVMHRPSTTAAIVAGGRARRFGGQDKSRLLVEGRTIIVRQVELLQPLASAVLVIAPEVARFADL